MHDPDSYDAYSQFQRRDAKELVPYLVSKMDWSSNDSSKRERQRQHTILDFGCGSGFNTRNILVPLLEEKSKKFFIHAVDVSQKMVDFASVKYTHPDLEYKVVDITNTKEGTEIQAAWKSKFDKIFSFHVLHWIPDQEKVLQLLFSMLAPNGEIGLFYLSSAAVFSVYDAMSRITKWSPYLSDAKNFIPKSHFSPDPAQDLHLIMTSVGYDVQEAKILKKSFEFKSVDEMIDAAMAANPFLHRIPAELQGEYKTDFRNSFTPLIHEAPKPEAPDTVNVDYDLILIRGRATATNRP